MRVSQFGMQRRPGCDGAPLHPAQRERGPTGDSARVVGAAQCSRSNSATRVSRPGLYDYRRGNRHVRGCEDRKGDLSRPVNAPGAYFASPVAAGGKVFVASAEGVVTVLGRRRNTGGSGQQRPRRTGLRNARAGRIGDLYSVVPASVGVRENNVPWFTVLEKC